MNKRVLLIAIKAHGYGGRRRGPGDTYEAKVQHAEALTRVGVSRFADVTAEAPQPMPAVLLVASPDPEFRKTTYKTRKMRAEP